ncbi:MAG TPA: glycosyltransferase family 39 protein [Myxococcota bacterium]|nr:glycosyltransferase family 39 protein [Myxococcota bacterium]
MAWGCVLSALAATVGAWAAGRRGRVVAAALLLSLAGVALRANLAERHWLSDWDERYHAIVGRNAIDDPLRPSVIPRPFDPRDVRNWGHARVWLHKPPLATWLIGASLATFGEGSEPAVRVPSLAFAGLGIFLTFGIGRRLLGAPVGLVAAGIHAWHARLAQLAAGLRATDHVDHQMIALVALGVWLALAASDTLARAPRRAAGWWLTASCGLAVGLALLAKSSPALVVVGVLGIALLVAPVSWRVRIAAPALALGIGLLVELPWTLYTRHAFPEQAAWFGGRNVRYFTEVVAGQEGPPWFYLGDMAAVFGWLAPVAVALFLWHGRARRELWPLFAWLLVPYGVFSLAQTKMTAYVLIAAPVVMLAMAWVWVEAWSRRPPGRERLAWRALALLLLAGFGVGSVLRVHRPWQHPERRVAWAEELRRLGAQVEALGPGPWVVFDVPSTTEAHFYTRATPVGRAPSRDDLARARRMGFRIAVYGAPPDAALAPPDVAWLPRDPRVAAEHTVLRQLPHPPRGSEVGLWNARDAGRLEDYLDRSLRVAVHEGLPDDGDLDRTTRARGIAAVLVAPGAPDPDLPPGRPWIRVESEAFARPLAP